MAWFLLGRHAPARFFGSVEDIDHTGVNKNLTAPYFAYNAGNGG